MKTKKKETLVQNLTALSKEEDSTAVSLNYLLKGFKLRNLIATIKFQRYFVGIFRVNSLQTTPGHRVIDLMIRTRDDSPQPLQIQP